MDSSKNSAKEYEAPDRGEQINSGTNQDFDYQTDTDKPVKDTAELATPDWSADNPIPVYVVSDAPEIPEINEASYERYIVTDAPIEIAGQKRSRTRMVIKADKANTDEIYIDRDQSVGTAFSYRLDAGEFLELTNNARVWARCASTKTANLSVVQEYTVALNIPRHV